MEWRHNTSFDWLVLGMLMLGSLCVILAAVYRSGMTPGHDGIVAHGTSPDGAEYLLVQAWGRDFYTICLYVRNPAGDWKELFLDPDGDALFDAEVKFSDNLITVVDGHRVYKKDIANAQRILPGNLDRQAVAMQHIEHYGW